MKTKNAFALQDFDKNKILARNFFDKVQILFNNETSKSGSFKVGRVTDKKLSDDAVLAEFYSAVTISEKECAYANLRNIYSYVVAYCRRISKHTKLIDELYKKIAVEISNITILSIENNSVTDAEKARFEELKPKMRRLKDLQQKYLEILDNCGDLQVKVSEHIDTLKGGIESAYARNFAENLKKRRKETGLNQEMFSATLGIARTDLAQFESGRKLPSFATICRIVNSPFGTGKLLELNEK